MFCLVASVKVFSPCFSFVVAVVRYLLPLLTRGIYKSFFQLGRSKKLVVFVCFQFLSHCLCCVFFGPHTCLKMFFTTASAPHSLHTPARGNQSYLSQPCQHGGKGLVFFSSEHYSPAHFRPGLAVLECLPLSPMPFLLFLFLFFPLPELPSS